MAKRNRSTANLIAGLFLIGGLAGFVAISAVLSGLVDRFGDSSAYTVRFGVERGAPGLAAGSAVTLGGQPIGRVTGVEFQRDASGATAAIDVLVSVNADQPLFTDARVVMVRPLLGGISSLDVIDPGSPDAGPLRPGETIAAVTAVPALLADAGFGDEQAGQVRRIIAKAAEVVDRSAEIAAKLDEDIGIITADAKGFSSALRETTDRVSERLPTIEQDVTAAATAIADAGAALERAAESGESLMSDSRALIEETRPRIEDTLNAAIRVIDRFDAEHLTAMLDLLGEATRAASDLADTAERVERLVAEGGPSVERTLANARLASDQLRQAAVEIRRNPWRVLARPDAKTTESEIIYDAARTHADAASDLRDAAAALDSVLAALSDDERADTNSAADTVRELQTELDAALERYIDSQASLRRLIEN